MKLDSLFRALSHLALGCLLLWGNGAGAQDRVSVALEAPDAVSALLRQHVRVLKSAELTVPEVGPDQTALVRRTRREVVDLLSTEGYFKSEVRLDRRSGDRWTLVVEPGVRAAITAVDIGFEGELASASDAEAAALRDSLRENWALPVGRPFRQSEWDRAKQQLLDAVSRRRYAAARTLSTRAEVNEAGTEVGLSVVIDSGPTFRLGELAVTGLTRLPADLVTRYSTVEAGDIYDHDALLALQEALQGAPQFASVVVDIERDPALAAAVPVRVQVAEAQSRRLSFGAGVSSNTGYRVEAAYRDVNILSRGWELSSGIRLEQLRQSVFADLFFPPAPDGHRDSIGALIDNSDLEGLKTESQAIGIGRTTVRGDIETQIALRLQHESLHPDGADSSSLTTLTANWTWVQRAVDNVLDPRRGHVLEVQIGGGSSIALAEQDFVRLYGRYQHYFPIGEADMLTLRGELGATLAPSRDGIPQDFLFRAGGSQSVRGYAYQSLGVTEGDATVGGRYLGTLSGEYVHWFRRDWGVAAFVDAGDAADSRSEFRLRTGYGLGARWRSPAGPLAIDLAWGHDDARLRLHFGVAVAF
ncbi:autotransporter assembly complex protein TamA [Parazoarcus communis]|uniref:autotransporter assembly complex protein TamA n=1 Tax=Parazoarcus communis TaxID=41977 RepID=UPI003B3BD615